MYWKGEKGDNKPLIACKHSTLLRIAALCAGNDAIIHATRQVLLTLPQRVSMAFLNSHVRLLAGFTPTRIPGGFILFFAS